MFEDEAHEEEEEDAIRGLGDFGFGVPQQTGALDEDEVPLACSLVITAKHHTQATLARIRPEDLECIVDEVSEDEGGTLPSIFLVLEL
jgi:hypothetical protein